MARPASPSRADRCWNAGGPLGTRSSRLGRPRGPDDLVWTLDSSSRLPVGLIISLFETKRQQIGNSEKKLPPAATPAFSRNGTSWGCFALLLASRVKPLQQSNSDGGFCIVARLSSVMTRCNLSVVKETTLNPVGVQNSLFCI